MTPHGKRTLENPGRQVTIVTIEALSEKRGIPFPFRHASSFPSASIFSDGERGSSRSGKELETSGERKQHRSTGCSEFLDLDRTRLRFLKDEGQSTARPPSCRGPFVDPHGTSMSPDGPLTLSYTVDSSLGLLSDGPRPNTEDLVGGNHSRGNGYGTRSTRDRYGVSRCLSSQDDGRSSGGGVTSRRQAVDEAASVEERNKYSRTCSNELINVITIDDGRPSPKNAREDCDVIGRSESAMVPELRLADVSFSASNRIAQDRKGRVDTRGPVRSRDDLLRIIDRAMWLTVSGPRGKSRPPKMDSLPLPPEGPRLFSKLNRRLKETMATKKKEQVEEQRNQK